MVTDSATSLWQKDHHVGRRSRWRRCRPAPSRRKAPAAYGKQQRQQPGGERHHQIVQKYPRSDRRRTRQDAFEILQLQMHAHTEHDQHQQGGDPWANWGEGGGSVQARTRSSSAGANWNRPRRVAEACCVPCDTRGTGPRHPDGRREQVSWLC